MAVASCATWVVGCGGSSAPSPVVGHSISVTVSGLSGSGLVLQVNGGGNLSISANGVATFPTPVDSGATYSVTVSTQPTKPGQTCSVNNGSGTVGTADITGIPVVCATTIRTLYSFNKADGIGLPNGSLVQGPDGSLYGTTTGAVFRITTTGEETTLYSFTSNSLGGTNAGLILASDGNFYGTTNGSGGGGNVSGSVYRISPSGTESEVYIWVRVDAGDLPIDGGVIQASNGLLYGTAYGSSVFSLSTAGGGESEFAITGVGSDLVQSSLLQARDGNLYGATVDGSVFKVVLPNSGPVMEATIGSIGTQDFGSVFSLIEGNDRNLYGTTSYGGGPSATCSKGCGTVFKITPSGVATSLHSFGASSVDGQRPSGALVLATDGNFYGTTLGGGSPNPNCKAANGCGTLYKITPDGTETVLYSFGTAPSDGTGPSGALLQASDGSLYGTTTSGGSTGSGTVFKLEPGLN
jgi:uncharacterized repeat protein (TIGR03803 family)